MNSESRNGSNIDPENVIAVTFDDLSEDDRLELENEIEQEIEKDRAEKRRLKLAGF